jgi:creatinine amidohydrolase
MHFEDLNWMDVESYLKQDDRVVLISGACEQHTYLSLLSDIRSPLAMARAAAEREHVLIAPPLNFGISPYFTAYPGTISLRVETFTAIVREVIGELIRGGFRRILVCNGHGGNTGALANLLIEVSNANPGVACRLFEWWTHPAVVKVATEAGLKVNHANWAEAFRFNRVADSPPGVKPDAALPRIASGAEFRQALGDGNFGGLYQAPDDVMDKMFDAAVEAMLGLMRDLKV